ncbi:hypothetical protein [Streptomyces cellostaticus]|uniref:hypothetical protein n=1 Tax=Streptomyces cellostaticus TaxID=67285 RepID=UPI002025F640|nr:hypothetical protein [Streptomyces cellostaticus]
MEASVVAHVTGSRTEALAELERRARVHLPAHPLSARRRRLLRQGDGFLLVVDGAWQSFATRFTVAELLEDSAAPAAPQLAAEQPAGGTVRAAAGPVPAPPGPERTAQPEPEPDVERYADGVPVRPSWLGRGDLP